MKIVSRFMGARSRMQGRIAGLLSLGLVALPLLAACGDPAPTPSVVARDKVILSLGYIPNVQFAPYYVAQDKGYYEAENIDVDIKYGQVTDLLKVVAEGSIQFANVSGDELVPGRAQDIAAKYIMTQYYRYPIAAVAIAGNKAPLTKPADLKGRTIGLPGLYGSNYIGLKALLQAGGLTENDVTLASIGFTQVDALANNQVDVAMVYSMNEPVQLKARGKGVESLEVSDFAQVASVGLVTGDKLIASNPGLVERFVRATSKGVAETLRDPGAAFDISMKRTPEISGDAAELQRAVLTATIPFMTAPSSQKQGWSDPTVWTATEKFVRESGGISKEVDPSTLFTNDFVGK